MKMASSVARVQVARALVAVQFLLLAIIGIFALSNISGSTHSYLLLEAGAVILGGLIIAIAGIALRPSLRISPIPKSDAPLIATGIYRLVRHPMYLGVILIGFGLAGYAGGIFSWILEAILILDLNLKARFEDKLLREIHPESIHYQLHVSRLIPCVGGSCRTTCIPD